MTTSTTRDAPLLKLDGLAKSFGGHVAIHPMDMSVAQGDFLALLGPSGCGKTTLLRLIGGFLRPDAGRVEIDGIDVTRLSAARRPTNTVFQGYGLFPHMTVRQNVAYGMKIARSPAAKRDREVGAMLEMMHISQFADRLPADLSGGQQQRVALARALVMKPRVLLLDEPLAALDLQLRKSMQEELRNIHREIGGTFICVTHDQEEAIALANRIAVMNAGKVMQEGTPEQIYNKPANLFVAKFVGESNILRLKRQAGRCRLSDQTIDAVGPDGDVAMMVRPGDIRLGESVRDAGSDISVKGRITDAVFMGDRLKLVVTLDTGEDLVVHRPQALCEPSHATPGQQVVATWSRDACQVLEG